MRWRELVNGHVLDPGAGIYLKLSAVFEAECGEHVSKDADTVATHLGDGAVRVTVVHEPAVVHPSNTEEAVRTNSGASVAERGNEVSGEHAALFKCIVSIDDYDKVVFSPVRFDKSQAPCAITHPSDSSAA